MIWNFVFIEIPQAVKLVIITDSKTYKVLKTL